MGAPTKLRLISGDAPGRHRTRRADRSSLATSSTPSSRNVTCWTVSCTTFASRINRGAPGSVTSQTSTAPSMVPAASSRPSALMSPVPLGTAWVEVGRIVVSRRNASGSELSQRRTWGFLEE